MVGESKVLVLSVIGSVLKIIGIILLVLLGVLLAAVLLILFAPLRYEAELTGRYEQEEEDAPQILQYTVSARVSWLLRLVSVRFRADETSHELKIRICGVLLSGRKKKKKRKQEGKTKKQEAPVLQRTEAKTEETPVSREPASAPGKEVPVLPEKSESGADSEPDGGRFRRLVRTVKGFFQKLVRTVRSFLERFRSLFRNIRGRLKRLMKAAGEIRSFLGDERNQEAIRFLLQEGKKMLKTVLPRKCSGTVSFSLEDPAATGKVLIALGFAYPVLQDRIRIVPLFENRTCAEGNLSLKGRIRAFSLLIIILRVWFDKRVKAFLKRGQKLREHMG